jgi:acyl-CoA synthetase (AMP-forming)/AMP-acid ligase II
MANLKRARTRSRTCCAANGLKRGDTIVVFMENNLEYLAICWGAQRAGLVYVAMATKLTAEEAGYIVSDSGASVIFAGASLAAVAANLPVVTARYALGGALSPATNLTKPPSPNSRRPASPTNPAAATCSIRAAPPAAPRACAARCPKASLRTARR